MRELIACTAALLMAAIVSTAILSLISLPINPPLGLLPFAFVVVLGHAALLGVPLFLVLRAKRWVNAISAIAGGFIVGAAPLTLASGGRGTLATGVVFLFGLLGASGGLAFWLVWKWLALGSNVPSRTINMRTVTVFGLIALSFSIAALIPTIIKDRTCHNMFRDGRTSIGHPQVSIDLTVAQNERQKLVSLLEDFGKTYGLSFRNSGKINHRVEFVAISLCNEDGLNIEVNGQYLDRIPLMADRGIPIGVYEMQTTPGWQRLAKELVEELNSAWPGKVRFRDTKGEIIPSPKELLN